MFFWVFPGSFVLLSDIDHSNYDLETAADLITNKLLYFSERSVTKKDFYFLLEKFICPLATSQQLELPIFGSLAIFSIIVSNNFENESQNIPFDEDQFAIEALIHSHALEKQLTDYYVTFFREELITKYYVESSTTEKISKMILNKDLYTLLHARVIFDNVYNLIWFGDYQDSFFLEPFNIRLLQFSLIFIIVSLFFKLALAPFHLWSPDVYEGSPTSSTFFFAVISKLGIFVLLLRIFYYSFYGFIDNWRHYIVLIAVLSVIVGSFGGIEQRKLKTLLAYSSISHIGYTLLAFTTGTFEGFQMLFCYLIIYMLSGLCIWSIFLLTRLKNLYKAKQNKDLADLVLLKKSNQILAFIFAIVLLSIAGFPPMIGFFVKMGVFLVTIEASLYFVALISILCSVISTFYYIRIVKILYFEKVLVGRLYYPITTSKVLIVIFPFYLLLFLFVNPTALYLFSYKLSLLFIN